MNNAVSALAALFFMFAGSTSLATPLSGDARFYDVNGQDVVGPLPITGDLDISAGTMTVDSFLFFGNQWNTVAVELLGEGTHMRPDGGGGTITATVGPGQLGAYITHEWVVNQMQNFMVWDVNSHATGSSYTTVDSDGDGIPGHAFTAGPFVDLTVVYDFIVGDPPPGIDVSIGVTGGNIQECNETGGNTVSLAAVIELSGGAQTGSVEWYIDGESAGSGQMIDAFLALGARSIDVTASTTTGESASASTVVEIRDTTAPVLDLAFVDRNGQVITETPPGVRVGTRIKATDVCDPEPVSEGTAVPVFAVNDGDMIRIQENRFNSVKLPTSAIDLTATASDASDNMTTGMTVLTITD